MSCLKVRTRTTSPRRIRARRHAPPDPMRRATVNFSTVTTNWVVTVCFMITLGKHKKGHRRPRGSGGQGEFGAMGEGRGGGLI